MNHVVLTALLSFTSGVIGTGTGGLLGAVMPRPSRRLMSATLAFAGGIMFSMVAFDLMPAAIERGGLPIALPGLGLGLAMMLLVDVLMPAAPGLRGKPAHGAAHYHRMGILMALGIGAHNLAEGLAIGSGYVVTHGLGIGVAVAMAIHDVPEGLAMAAPLRLGGMSGLGVTAAAVVTGFPTALGGLVGGALGGLSPRVLSACLSIAGGAMLSIVANQLLPDAKEASSKGSSLGFGVGVMVGILLAVGL